jgi:serine/threonine-protein kinase
VQARAILERQGFDEIEVERVRSSFPLDQVLDQDPDPGESVSKDDAVTLEVSDGPGTVNVPSVRNLPLERAAKELTKAGLKFNVDEEPSSSIREGFAIRTSPQEGQEVERGSRVRLFVSSGPELVAVPDVIGRSRDSAEDALAAEGFDVIVEEQEAEEPEDEVIGQTPEAGSRIEKGESVTITVSTGQPQVDVPNVIGLSAADASRMITAEGLRVAQRERTVTDESQDGVVVDQRPPAGVEIDEGRTVIIVVGVFEEPFTPPEAEVPTP